MRKFILIGVMALALMATPLALAETSPVDAQYATVGTKVQQVLGSEASSSNLLPFTGLDLAIVLIGGIALVGAGVGLRRVARKSDSV